MKKSFVIVLSIFVVFGFSGCSSMAKVTSGLASIAGATGLVDESLASAVSKSADSVAVAAEDFTPEQEYYIGRGVAGSILTRYKLYSNPKLEKYLNLICNAMVVNSSVTSLYKGYHVAILDTDEINAFATSGGHILVTKGLIKCTGSEDALAAVIAHELSHIQLGHSIKSIRSSRTQTAVKTTAAQTAFAATGGNQATLELANFFNDTVGAGISVLVDSGYSQSQEFDADENALVLMNDAGYNVYAMNDMLTLLQKNTVSKTVGFGKTHPTPEKRIKNLEKTYSKYKKIEIPQSRKTRFSENVKL